ncbi:MAG TPA: MBL fold metallo-hydrolase [Syntrophomonadaceae bacterium]|nr:MBL fold metallo-hydrolase [Syntrophomonadaceae bacterium]
MNIPFGQRTLLKGAPFAIYRLEGYISNIYIVEYQNDLLLFDSGAACDARTIELFLQKTLHRSPADIKLAFVSHIHPDHAGGIQSLRGKYQIAVAAHPNIDLWYAGIGGFIQQQIDSVMMLQVGLRSHKKLARVGFDRMVQPDFVLEDKDPLPFFDDWLTVFVPGHTLHDVVIYNQTARVLYAGDCICNVNGRFLSPLPLIFKDTMRQSYDKLAALDVDTILLAHGEPIGPPLAKHIFADMKQSLDLPPTWMTRQVNFFSHYSPEVWKNKRKYS